ncbi:MAG: hypothetical protein KAS04_01790 [Candidatus Aenigmarchaeota archaeon]|nr:hypothetical protein [Candidatus Aenigmarchaeota archaeon]
MVYEVIGTIAGFVVAFILFWLRDIHLFRKREKRQLERELIKTRLEKLYTPLYMMIKSSEWLTGKKILGFSQPVGEKGDGKQKTYLDSTIQQNLHLASDELHELLPKVFGAGYFKTQKDADIKKLVNLIIKEYEELRKEYLTCE